MNNKINKTNETNETNEIDVYDVSSPRAIKTLKHVHCVPYKKELDRKSLQAKSLATN